MPKSHQEDPDIRRLSRETDRDRRDAENRMGAIEDYLAGPLFAYLTQLAAFVVFAPPPPPPWLE